MAKPALMIDILGKGPGDEEDDASPPFDDEEDEDPEDRAPADPEAIISDIEQKLAALRQAV